MTMRVVGLAVLSSFLALHMPGAMAQNGKQQHAAQLAYEAEMAHDAGACPEAQTVADRDICLNDARVETYKNYQNFFDALREALIENSPNDGNALALDGTERAWEKYRTTECDVLDTTYDSGTVKHPGSSAPSARTRCLILLTRSRMRDLQQLYAPTL
jgi:uncharacterized protein YecT (DUF1311 family)